MPKNLFCKISDLTNESAVEQFFINRLLEYLGYEDRDIKPKTSIHRLAVGRGSTKENYKPDYAIELNGKTRLVIDAKSPEEDLQDWVYQPSGYCLSINQQDPEEDSAKYFILSNGNVLELYRWNNINPIVSMNFPDFEESNKRFKLLKKTISKKALERELKKPKVKEKIFPFEKPSKQQIEGIFRTCHNLIWKKEKKKPTEAFYEFTKVFFVKLEHDKRIHRLGDDVQIGDYKFSVDWITNREDEVDNPVNDILFKQLRDRLEKQVRDGEMKRIFRLDEKINLKPSTIKEVVRILQNIDLYGIDEDLNGRMFETFLTATIRGKELGQFFTPRSVVEFMVELADLKCDSDRIDCVLDACCGSGGFLIDAMVRMWNKIDNKQNLTDVQKERLKNRVVTEHLWGMDADKDERLPISRVARMNMVFHGDSSNRIYWIPDSLDKNIEIEKGIDYELREEAKEIKEELLDGGRKFDVVLTNPPFSMRYEKGNDDERRILEEYEISRKSGSGDLRSSVKSNVLFLERYRDLLKPHGKLITVIDESVLNTISETEFRNFIRDNFIVKAVISLPWNTFVNAGAGVKTSVLYLLKKEKEDEKQPSAFMAISKNVGHDDSGKRTPELNDLPHILEEFRGFEHE